MFVDDFLEGKRDAQPKKAKAMVCLFCYIDIVIEKMLLLYNTVDAALEE